MSGIGHNGGPSMEPGAGFRKVAWKHAREALLPALPLEVVRIRVARAKSLGLPYRTYASIRAATGEDIVAFLFSSNALQVVRPTDALPRDKAEALAALAARRHASAARAAPALEASGLFETVRPAPAFTTPWSGLRAEMKDWLRAQRLPADRVVMVGATAFEREHAMAGDLAAFLHGETYFGAPA